MRTFLEQETAHHDDGEDDRPGRHGQEQGSQGEVTRVRSRSRGSEVGDSWTYTQPSFRAKTDSSQRNAHERGEQTAPEQVGRMWVRRHSGASEKCAFRAGFLSF